MNVPHLVVFFTTMVALEGAKFPPPRVDFAFRAAVAVASTPGTLDGVLIIECALYYMRRRVSVASPGVNWNVVFRTPCLSTAQFIHFPSKGRLMMCAIFGATEGQGIDSTLPLALMGTYRGGMLQLLSRVAAFQCCKWRSSFESWLACNSPRGQA